MNGKAWLFGAVGLVLAFAPAALVLAIMPPRDAEMFALPPLSGPKGALDAATPSTPGAFNGEPTCAEWSDGCVTCLRQASGPPSCSTPGIACIRGPAQCVRRDGT